MFNAKSIKDTLGVMEETLDSNDSLRMHITVEDMEILKALIDEAKNSIGEVDFKKNILLDIYSRLDSLRLGSGASKEAAYVTEFLCATALQAVTYSGVSDDMKTKVALAGDTNKGNVISHEHVIASLGTDTPTYKAVVAERFLVPRDDPNEPPVVKTILLLNPSIKVRRTGDGLLATEQFYSCVIIDNLIANGRALEPGDVVNVRNDGSVSTPKFSKVGHMSDKDKVRYFMKGKESITVEKQYNRHEDNGIECDPNKVTDESIFRKDTIPAGVTLQ
jgi:hypothetical protein